MRFTRLGASRPPENVNHQPLRALRDDGTAAASREDDAGFLSLHHHVFPIWATWWDDAGLQATTPTWGESSMFATGLSKPYNPQRAIDLSTIERWQLLQDQIECCGWRRGAEDPKKQQQQLLITSTGCGG